MVKEADDSRLAGVTVLSSGIGLFTFFPRLSAIVGRYSFDNLAGDLKERKGGVSHRNGTTGMSHLIG